LKNISEKQNSLDSQAIKEAYESQKKNGDWTFYQEREFLENLLQTRFNFLLTVYALFVNAFFMAQTAESKLLILILGLLIVGIMSLLVYRIYMKLDIVLKILYKLDKYHVFLFVKNETDKRKIKLFNVIPFVGYVIPFFLLLSIIAGIVLMFFGKYDFK